MRLSAVAVLLRLRRRFALYFLRQSAATRRERKPTNEENNMSITDIINTVFGDVRGIITQAVTDAGVRLDEGTLQQIVTATEAALANEVKQLQFHAALQSSLREQVSREVQRFLRQIGAHPNGAQVL
jgi:hypothetical protein